MIDAIDYGYYREYGTIKINTETNTIEGIKETLYGFKIQLLSLKPVINLITNEIANVKTVARKNRKEFLYFLQFSYITLPNIK